MQGDSVQNCFPNPRVHCFSGPDGIADDRVHLLKDAPPIETGAYTRERTVDVEYLWRPAPGTPFHRPRATFSGEVGWHAWFFLDTDPIRTGHQLHLSEFRRQVEDRCTHFYHSPRIPKRGADTPRDRDAILRNKNYPHSDGPRAQKKCTSNELTSLQHGYDPRSVPLQWKPWAKPPLSTMITEYSSRHNAWVDDNIDSVAGHALYHEAKAKRQSPAVEAKTPQTPGQNTLTPWSTDTTPISPSEDKRFVSPANSQASGVSFKSRTPHSKASGKSDTAASLGVQAAPSHQISSNDQNINRGTSDLFVTLQAIDDASSQVRPINVDTLPSVSGPSHISLSSASSGRSHGSQPFLPRSRASTIPHHSPVIVPRRLNSALELRRKESPGNTRSLSVDQTRHN